MAAAEYVSVSSQSDTEKADLGRERRELAENPDWELRELQQIYVGRGLDAALAQRVAEQLTRTGPWQRTPGRAGSQRATRRQAGAGRICISCHFRRGGCHASRGRGVGSNAVDHCSGVDELTRVLVLLEDSRPGWAVRAGFEGDCGSRFGVPWRWR